MLRPLHPSRLRNLAASTMLVLTLGLTACGSSDEKVVATVGKTKLSQATLSHWMRTTLGGDYRAELGASAPEGLVSDPVNYPRCISAARQIVSKAGGKAKARPSDAQLRVKCRQLNAGIREQALGYVLSVLWAIEEGNELGIHVSEGEVTRRMRELADRDYHGPLQFSRTLTELRRTVADERFLVKRNILEDLFLDRIKKQTAKLGGGQRTLVKLVLQSNAKWNARTNCSPGYVAWECKGYKPSQAASVAPAVVLDALGRGV
jgi:hypothetical protein